METSATWSIAPAEVRFVATTSALNAEYHWSFGDGEEAIGAEAVHVYQAPGTYAPTVTVFDAKGHQDSATAQIEVVAAGSDELAGTLSMAAAAIIDGDVNDPDHPQSANNTPGQAQSIHSAATVAGFATAQPTGRAGDAMATAGDPWDYFRTFLLKDQAVTLAITAHAADSADLDLYLLDDAGALIAAAKGTGPIEQLQVPADGTYLIAVQARQGRSGYLLTLDSTILPQSPHSLVTSADFVPDEAIVTYTPATDDPYGATPLAAPAHPSGMQLVPLGGGLAGAAPQNLATEELPHIRTTTEQEARLRTLEAIKALRRDPQVRVVSPNFIRTPSAVPNDPLYPSQWHYELIDLPRAWDQVGSGDAVVAVLDSGVFLAHPDLADNLTADGYDFIASPTKANDGDGIDPDPDDPGDLAHGSASSWHGTHVAGTVAALSDNGLGVSAVARRTRIMPVRVLGVDGGTDYDILQGIRYAAGLPNDSGVLPQRCADIINLSLGGAGYSPHAQETIGQARAAGVIVIAAAGNQGSSTPSYPAAYDGVISVGAVGADAKRASYSNYGPSLDLMAPGGNQCQDLDGDGHGDGILSTSVREQTSGRTAGYNFQQGTSMAAPHVAGVAALMKTIYPELTPAEFSAALGSGAITDDLGAAGRDDLTGYGLVNAAKALGHATELLRQNAPADLAIAPRTLNFGGILNWLEFDVRRQGEAPLQVRQVTAAAAWIRLSAVAVDSAGFGRYQAAIERGDLAEGLHSAEITVLADDGQVERISVYLQASTGGFASPAAAHLELRHAESASLVRRERIVADDGRHPFVFPNLPAAGYTLRIGTDLDHDGRLCEPGELCGAYPADGRFTFEAGEHLQPLDVSLFAQPLAAGTAAGFSPK